MPLATEKWKNRFTHVWRWRENFNVRAVACERVKAQICVDEWWNSGVSGSGWFHERFSWPIVWQFGWKDRLSDFASRFWRLHVSLSTLIPLAYRTFFFFFKERLISGANATVFSLIEPLGTMCSYYFCFINENLIVSLMRSLMRSLMICCVMSHVWSIDYRNRVMDQLFPHIREKIQRSVNTVYVNMLWNFFFHYRSWTSRRWLVYHKSTEFRSSYSPQLKIASASLKTGTGLSVGSLDNKH